MTSLCASQLIEALDQRISRHPEGIEVDMIAWMGRTALELIGQAGLGYSFDSLVADAPDDFGTAIKAFQCVNLRATLELPL